MSTIYDMGKELIKFVKFYGDNLPKKVARAVLTDFVDLGISNASLWQELVSVIVKTKALPKSEIKNAVDEVKPHFSAVKSVAELIGEDPAKWGRDILRSIVTQEGVRTYVWVPETPVVEQPYEWLSYDAVVVDYEQMVDEFKVSGRLEIDDWKDVYVCFPPDKTAEARAWVEDLLPIDWVDIEPNLEDITLKGVELKAFKVEK